MAANIFIGATSANWNTATNWSLGAVPTNADGNVATFDATSPNCTVNVAANCQGLDFTGYTNTLTMTNNILVTNGTVTFQANQNLRVAGTQRLRLSGTCTLVSNGGTWNNDFETNNGTYTLTGTATITGNYSALGPSNNVVNGSMNIGGNLTITAGIHSGTGTYTLIGTGTWSGGGTLTKNLTFNTAGTLTFSGTTNYHTGTILNTAIGTLVKTGHTLNINAGATPPTLNTGTMIWNNITTQMTSNAITLSSDLAYSGTWTVANTTTVNGAFNINCTGTLSTGAFIFAGTATFKFVSGQSGSWTGNGNMRLTVVVDAGSNLTMSGTIGVNVNSLTINEVITSSGCTLSIINGGWTLTNNIAGTTFAGITFTPNGALTLTLTGTEGLTIGTLTYTQTSGAASLLQTKAGNTYTFNTAFTLKGLEATNIRIKSITASSDTFINLGPSCSQTVWFVDATDTNSSGGITVWDLSGTLLRTTNWNALTIPPTISSSFRG